MRLPAAELLARDPAVLTDFVARAPEEVVEENRERLAEAEGAKAKLEGALRRLETVG